jgi:hypothetical protein
MSQSEHAVSWPSSRPCVAMSRSLKVYCRSFSSFASSVRNSFVLIPSPSRWVRCVDLSYHPYRLLALVTGIRVCTRGMAGTGTDYGVVEPVKPVHPTRDPTVFAPRGRTRLLAWPPPAPSHSPPYARPFVSTSHMPGLLRLKNLLYIKELVDASQVGVQTIRYN